LNVWAKKGISVTSSILNWGNRACCMAPTSFE